jgi:hypothetical protein
MIDLEKKYNDFINSFHNKLELDKLIKKHNIEFKIIEQKIKQNNRKLKLKRLGLII